MSDKLNEVKVSEAKKPKAIRSGELKIGTLTMKIHVLDNGERVIEEAGVLAFMEWMESGEIVPVTEMEEFTRQLKTF